MRGGSDRDRAIALAGVFQAAQLVAQVARKGVADAEALQTTLASVFVLEPEKVEDVFGGSTGLLEGFRVMRQQLGALTAPRNLEITRYVVGLLHLERRLARRRDLLDRIRAGIEALAPRTDQRPPTDPQVIAGLGELYLATVSTLGPRIIVRGEPTLLARPDNAHRIRALLLAGIRATVLWRQCGGTRLGLLFGRQRLLEASRHEKGGELG